MELQQFLIDLLREGGTLGIMSWGITAFILKTVSTEPSNDAKRILSIAVSCVLILGSYAVGALLGYWPFDWNSLFLALKTLAVELAAAFTIFTATKKIQNVAKQKA